MSDKPREWEIEFTKWDNKNAEWRISDSKGPGICGFDSPPPKILLIEKSWADAEIAKRDAALKIAVEALEKLKSVNEICSEDFENLRLTKFKDFSVHNLDGFSVEARQALAEIEEVLK